MTQNKTRATDVDVIGFLKSVKHARRRTDALRLDQTFRKVTGFTPRMWGPTIVGYGSYDYIYESGRQGTSLACGFSPRKANMVLYVMPGYGNFGHILDGLGKYKLGKSCLYLGRLQDGDLEVLAQLIRAGLDDLGNRWSVKPN